MNQKQPRKIESPKMLCHIDFKEAKDTEIQDRIGLAYTSEGDFGDFVPLFKLPFPDLRTSGTACDSTLIKNTIKGKVKELNIDTASSANVLFSVYSDILTTYINSADVFSIATVFNGMTARTPAMADAGYYAMFNDMNYLHFTETSLRANAYYVGFGSCWDKKGTLLWTTAVKKEYVKYFKLCMLLGEEIDPRIYTFIIQNGFDGENTKHKPLRTGFRKFHKGAIERAGIPIIEMDLHDMCNGCIYKPKEVASILDYKKWEDTLLESFLEHATENQRLAVFNLNIEV